MAIDHLDREWVFRDLDLSGQAQDGKVKVRFELAADDGVNFFGGWNIDDVCVVAMTGPAVTCGNGVIDEAETCDDGNRLAGDGCNPNCAEEPEEPGDGGGCAAGGPAGLMGALFALVGLLRPRRRR
ncbi:MAG: MYXO-CTERM sorting domain-containing protein [Kofleriaceae bacterium]